MDFFYCIFLSHLLISCIFLSEFSSSEARFSSFSYGLVQALSKGENELLKKGNWERKIFLPWFSLRRVGDLASKEKIESVDAKSKRSTLEHVPNGESNKEPLLHQKVQGIRLFRQRFWTLVTKRCIYFQRTWITGVLHVSLIK
jgi:hypothetical protein